MATNVSGLSLNGTSDRAILSQTDTIKNLTGFTRMAWVKNAGDNDSSYKRLFVERQGTGTGIRFAITPMKGRIRFEFSAKDGVTDTNYDYKYTWNDRWHHVAFSARGIGGTNPTYEIFLDGISVAEGTLIVPSGVTAISNTNPMGGTIYLGNASFHTTGSAVYASDRYWKGMVDEIYTFNQAKNATEILAYITSKDVWATSDTDMVSAWRFDENTGTSTTSSKGSLTGTLTSAFWTVDRPFIGNGATDSTNPSAVTLPATPTTGITSDGFTATWNSTTDNVAVQYYELQVSLLSDFSSYTAYNMGLSLTKKITGLLPGTNYYWRARAFDAAGNAGITSVAQSLTTLTTGDLTAPNPPTALVASSISHVSFRVDWTASSSSDETGYKLDVALDSKFNTYLLGYRNKDIGNVTNHTVIGTDPLTVYYVRLRAYDAADNEGDDSAVISVQTANIPDTNAPLEVELLPPTSVDARSFTANWEEGIDDVGVSYYLLDVAYDEFFTQPLVIDTVTYSALNVGNVTSYHISGLKPETGLFYRVVAVDGAGNIGPYQADPMPVATLFSAIDEGGFVSTTAAPTDDAWTDAGATTTNNGTDTVIQVQGNGTVVTNYGFLLIDLTAIPGTIQNAMLSLYVRSGATGNISVQASATSFDETSITWANQPAVTGTPLVITNPTANSWVSVDLASILLAGPALYTIRLSTTEGILVSFDSREGTNPPILDVESDPNTATTVDATMTVESIASVVYNYVKNPSGEDSTTNFWAAMGTTPATLSNVATTAYNGVRAFQAVCGGTVANQGARYSNADIVAASGQYWTADVAVKLVSGSGALRLRVLEYSSGGTLLTSSTLNFTAITALWQRVSLTRLLNNASTAYVSMAIETQGATASTFMWDAAMMHGGTTTPTWSAGYFDGDTSGAAWSGTVKASTSYMGTAVFTVDSTYTGDSDTDNSVVPYIRPLDSDWFFFSDMQSQTTYDRTNKRVTTLVGPSYALANYIFNPSFAVDVSSWTLSNPNSNAAFVQDVDNYFSGIGSGKLTWGAGAGSGILSNKSVAAATEVWTARARVFIPTGTTVNLQIRALTSGGGFNASSTPVVGTSQLAGTDEWVELTETYTLPTGTGQVDVFLSVASTTAGTLYVDAVKLGKGSYNNPYIDGDMPFGLWSGTPHNSYTAFALQPLATYDFRHTYSDPDGIVNAIGDTTFDVGTTFLTAAQPDNVTTTNGLTLIASPTTLYYEASYTGDDNGNNSCKIEYKRTDLATWVTVTPTLNRTAKTYSGTIVDLKMGTSYTVRATFTDSDGIYNTNPITEMSNTLTDLGSPTAESTIMFSGFLLMGRSDGKIGVSEHNAFGFPERRVQIENLPRVDGAIELQNLWGQRTISMTGFVEGDTRGELDDNKNALKQALAPKLSQLVIDTLSNKGRFYYATCQSLAIAEKGGENIRHLVWDAEFVCADPFAYDSELTTIPEFSVQNGGTTTAANLGDVRVEPYFAIRTTNHNSLTLTIINNTTGERITPQTTILVGDRLVIDTAKKSVLKNGVEIDYIGSFPHLTTGSNQFSYILTASAGTPSALITVNWRHKYI